MDIRGAIANLIKGIDLTESEAVEVMNQIMTGEATPSQVASFLTALRVKGETVPEITGAARVMREKADRVMVRSSRVIDIVGTGGDQSGSFNSSTTVTVGGAGRGLFAEDHVVGDDDPVDPRGIGRSAAVEEGTPSSNARVLRGEIGRLDREGGSRGFEGVGE